MLRDGMSLGEHVLSDESEFKRFATLASRIQLARCERSVLGPTEGGKDYDGSRSVPCSKSQVLHVCSFRG